MTDSNPQPQRITSEQLDLSDASAAGQWMGWTGLGFALLWWIGAIAGAIAMFGMDALSQQPTPVLIASGVLILMPGLMMLMAGFLARQTKRTSEANLLLMKAADRLLAPAKQASLDIADLGQATRNSTIGINRTVTEALTAMKATHQAMADERLRVESVSYAMADNARDLTRRLSEERASLEILSKALTEQSETLNKAIPRQAAAMVEAAKAASAEVGRADEALEMRLEELKQAGSTLAVRLIDLDAVARDAASRTDALNGSVSKIEQKLEQSQRTIEMAERASEMAVDAAATTGNALRDAISAALDGARDANKEIAETSELIQKRSAQAMTEMAAAGKAAASAAARVQEQSHILSGNQPAEPISAPAGVEADIFQEPATPQHPSPLPSDALDPAITAHNDYPFDEDITSGEDELFEGAGGEPAAAEAAPLQRKPGKITEDDLFVQAADIDDDAMQLGDANTPFFLNQSLADVAQPSELTEDPVEEIAPAEPALKPRHPSIIRPADNAAPGNGSSEWRDIIADIGNEAEEAEHPSGNGMGPADTDIAEALIHRLESTGIPLSTAFKSRDKKKISIAASKDSSARRSAIRNAAGNEVDRVAIRLKKDSGLMRLARNFLISVEPDALRTLAETGRNGRRASTNLSAYLLIDAAIGDTLADENRRAG